MSGKRENEVLQNEPAPGAAGVAPPEPIPAEPEVVEPPPPPPVENVVGPLRQWLKCEKCGSIVAKRFKVCHRGHLACGKCVKSRRTKCPQCKVKYVTDSPVVVKKMLELVLEHDARRADK